MRLSKVNLIIVALVSIVSFAAGFFAHRSHLQDPVRTVGAFLIGEAGGCDLTRILEAPKRAMKLRRSFEISGAETKFIGGGDDGFSQWDTPLGKFWVPPRNSPQFAIGEQIAEVYTEGDMKLGPGDVVLDCGANIGDFVRVCLRSGVAKVIAIDPSPNNIEAIRRNFEREIGEGRVVLVPKGVWDQESTMTMILYENSLLDSFVMRDRIENERGPKPRELTLPVTTIDNIVAELGLDKVTFIKMDIEGAERNAIRGAAKTIARFRPRMSVATENLKDDYLVVPQEVNKICRDYRVRCGLCRATGWFAYRPDILFFTPTSR